MMIIESWQAKEVKGNGNVCKWTLVFIEWAHAVNDQYAYFED